MYKRAKQSWMKHIDFIIMDFLCIQLAFLLAYAIRYAGHGIQFAYNASLYRMIGIILCIMHICIVFFTNNYSGILRRGYFVEFRKIVSHNAILLAGVFASLVLAHIQYYVSRSVLIMFAVLNVCMMYVTRTIRKKIIVSTNDNKSDMHHMLVITTVDEMGSVLDNMDKISYSYKVIGIALVSDKKLDRDRIGDIPVVAYNRDEAFEFACKNVVDEVFIYIPNANPHSTELIANTFLQMGISVHINLDMISSGMPNVAVERLGDYMVMTSSVNVMSPIGAFCKRSVDIIAGVVGCLITCVLYLILAPAIKIADPGPVFFGQKRVGKNGRIFTIYKFRSMYQDAEERKKELMKQNKMEGLMFKMDSDPRIIGSGPDGKRKGLGYWIRTLSLDEFPNFYSILKGDMSLVGTRPPTLDEYERYSPHHKSRLAAKPGLTGMWQVSGRSNITDFEEIVELDNEYIRNWSFTLDIKIILKTFLVVLKRKGSI